MEEHTNNEEKLSIDTELNTKLLDQNHHDHKGGLRTMPFIIVNEAFERIASYGLTPNMIFYLMEVYHMEAVTGTSILSIWSALSNTLSIFGAYISDSYLGRFHVIAIGSLSTLFGMTFLWLTSMVPQLTPSSCNELGSSCSEPSLTQLAFLFSTFGLLSIGSGCIRPCSIAFGADQLKHHPTLNNQRLIDSYFNWFLNKACVLNDLNVDSSCVNPWSVSTVEKVESLKSIIRIIPIWSSGIILFTTITQNFPTLQANTMNRHITSSFEIPAASFTLFMVLTVTLWIAIYDRILVPVLANLTHEPRGLNTKTRMGIGLLISILAMVVSAIVESIRRHVARSVSNTHAMSAMWLVPQYSLCGLAEAFNAVGQLEFYYSELPKSMSSLPMALFMVSNAISGLVSSLLINVVNSVTSEGGKVSWLSSDMNEGHIDYYYWLLSFLNLLNFFYYLLCCRAHRSLSSSSFITRE
ncbi:protein NRT1/ PTR FAMILY 1.2-like isoform X2 [Rutidosis leptorrhynchoides]|uniref:protein NRT1/ PTR FAMILY 1.2-like isoform X2 n=1 Tax=Rutidosis leptorrhynchoides TaxID=125765 RepID=UPI003A9A5215